MVKEMKRKLFVCLLALVLIVTLMPAAAFAENAGGSGGSIEGDGPQPEIDSTPGKLFIALYWEDDENNEHTISQENAGQARFELKKTEEEAYSADNSAGNISNLSLSYDNNGKSYIDVTSVEYGTYTLSETTAPKGYSVSDNNYEILINSYGIHVRNGAEFGPVNDEGLKFYHGELFKMQIPIHKTVESVGAAAPENAKFTATLSAIRLENDVPKKVIIGISEPFGTTQGEKEMLTFSIDQKYTRGDELYLEENNAGEAGWTYDTRIYAVSQEITILSLGDEDGTDDEYRLYDRIYDRIYEVDSDYSHKSEDPTNVATFTNIYTAYSGGGGSHARYYNIKVNGGKALDFLGSEVTRASSGSTIQVHADAAAEGKVFKGWEVVKGGITAGEASEFSFIMPRADVELTAVYEDTAVKEPDIEEPEDPTEPEQPDEDAEEQKETPVPKTGDSMTMELMLFAVLAAGAAFGMKKAYNKTK